MLIKVDSHGIITLPLSALNKMNELKENYVKFDFDNMDDGEEHAVMKPAALRCEMCGYEFGVHKVLNLHLCKVCDIKLKHYYDKQPSKSVYYYDE